ncbi:hypothetical protein [Rhizobium lentis]|uniref:hypothetical protein n=3 Tax=Rhizobium lentis TaxID=1138194 RepID=UPI001FEA692B|nr:hypothetical protein [Rhizobium lentis]
MTTGEIQVLEGRVGMRKSVSLISLLLAFVAIAGERHAAISYQRVDGGAAGRALVITGVFESDDPMQLVDEYRQYQVDYISFDSPGGNVICRTSVDREGPQTLRACKRRDELGPLLNRADWCYGQKDEAGINWEWHKCDANSRRYE